MHREDHPLSRRASKLRSLARRAICLASLIVVVEVLAAESPGVTAEPHSREAGIAAASRAFSDAYVRNDVDAIKNLHTEDALLLPPGREVRGREAAGELFRELGRLLALGSLSGGED